MTNEAKHYYAFIMFIAQLLSSSMTYLFQSFQGFYWVAFSSFFFVISENSLYILDMSHFSVYMCCQCLLFCGLLFTLVMVPFDELRF